MGEIKANDDDMREDFFHLIIIMKQFKYQHSYFYYYYYYYCDDDGAHEYIYLIFRDEGFLLVVRLLARHFPFLSLFEQRSVCLHSFRDGEFLPREDSFFHREDLDAVLFADVSIALGDGVVVFKDDRGHVECFTNVIRESCRRANDDIVAVSARDGRHGAFGLVEHRRRLVRFVAR